MSLEKNNSGYTAVERHWRNVILATAIGGALTFVGVGGLDDQRPGESTEAHREKIAEAILSAPIGGALGFTSYYLGLIGLAGVTEIKKRKNSPKVI